MMVTLFESLVCLLIRLSLRIIMLECHYTETRRKPKLMQLVLNLLMGQRYLRLGFIRNSRKNLRARWGTLYFARIIKIKEEEGIRNYYFYEYGLEYQHFAVVVAVSRGKAYIAGASAPESRWEEDGVKHHSAAISLSLL
ncbi:hypothetical protein MKW98_029935 [Papaver atlanticum]|uniref:PsbP C-terminal domain-containing protein n=1 Tax=Papaver atlanticum TaxID=357466 RepID=A0AAD4TI34_9MAGN|nr:hypothetical protein MKW98_029935 [Papaver atlanticum]